MPEDPATIDLPDEYQLLECARVRRTLTLFDASAPLEATTIVTSPSLSPRHPSQPRSRCRTEVLLTHLHAFTPSSFRTSSLLLWPSMSPSRPLVCPSMLDAPTASHCSSSSPNSQQRIPRSTRGTRVDSSDTLFCIRDPWLQRVRVQL